MRNRHRAHLPLPSLEVVLFAPFRVPGGHANAEVSLNQPLEDSVYVDTNLLGFSDSISNLTGAIHFYINKIV